MQAFPTRNINVGWRSNIRASAVTLEGIKEVVPMSRYEPDVNLKDRYKRMADTLEVVRKRLNRPLSYAEKVVYGHLDDPNT